MFYVVCYDIADDKRRVKVYKAMEGFGRRVQFSVYECLLDEAGLADMRARIGPLLEPRADGVRIYPLCSADVRKVKILGQGRITEAEPFRIV